MSPEGESSLRISPIASDSMGVRSMATSVKTADISLIIDPGVALGPWRAGLPPHRKEIERLKRLWGRVKEECREAQVILITHYHYDHLNPQELEIFDGKSVFIKDPEDTNASQKRRGKELIRRFTERGIHFEISNKRSLLFGETRVVMSPSFPHGGERERGTVIMVTIENRGKSFLFSSDIEGIPSREQLEYILKEEPDFIYLDGPPTYLLGDLLSRGDLEKRIRNMKIILEEIPPDLLIFDHHLLRDRNWREKVEPLLLFARKREVRIETAASFIKKRAELLEANRKALYFRGF